EIAEIDRRLASLDQNLPTANTELLALRTMALYQLSRPDEARRCLQHLRDRQDDRKAAAWALSLEAKFESAGQPASVVLDKLTSAITRDADNGITRAWAAEQYWQLGEMSLALRHWNTASLLMGSWSQPFIGISQALMQMGQPADAIKAAQSAFDRSPDLAAAINLAVVRYNASEAGSDAQRTGDAPLRELVSRVQQIQPGEPRTLPIHVALLAASGDTAGATAALDGVISTAASTDAATLLRLAMVSRTYALDRHDALIECTPSDGVTASLALARAQALADQGRPDAGRALMQPTPPPVDGLTWELARATYLESIQDPSAAALWKSLGDAHPQSLEVQRTLLATAASVRGDRPFVLQSIDRLRNLTGESGQQWKLERARWLIESPNVMRDSVEAATLLKEIAADAPRQITPRLQLARALERMGNTASAIEHLREAQNLEPRSVAVGLELVRLLQQKGQIDSVRSVLKRIVEDGQINPVQRVRVAAMFAEINEGESAIALLKAAKPNTLPASGNLLLAELHRRAGQSDEAQAVYDALLAVERPAASVMASAAEFYATRGQFDQARKVLSRMSEGSATAAESAIAWGRFEERFATPSAAEAHYRRAAAAQSEAGHLALIDYLLRRRDFTQAIAACRDAVAKLPTSTALASRLLESQALARQTRTPSNLEPLINALSQDPARAAEVEALKAVSEIKNKRLSREQITPRLREVADRFPLFLPLQEQVIERYLQQNKPNEAITVARRTMEALPADASAAQLAVRTMRAARRWSDMRLAAEQWRSRLGGRTLDADTAIAEALVEMKQPAEALKHLEPMRDAITADVRTQPLAAVVLARAMVARGDGAAARDMLAPLLKDAAGRRMWLMIANAGTPSLTEAAAWLDRVAAATPKERWEERWSVASTMVNIARKFDDAATLQRACDVLTAYLDAHPRDGDALLLQAGVYQQLGKSQAAETSLRAVLELKPGQAAAANDLAYLLLSQNRVLDEAETLARRAVEGAPEAGAFHDTLARVLHARGRRDAARISFETALRLEPELVEARVGFARVLYDNGDVAAAQRELRRIENQLKANPAAAKHVQSELSLVREQLSKID
ncbi:MAG TPA: tetratricopeptide repeat protein, partial [Tepidisphaeraceae bacterium]